MNKTEQKIVRNLITYGQHGYCYNDRRACTVIASLNDLGVIGDIIVGPGGTIRTAYAYRSNILAKEG